MYNTVLFIIYFTIVGLFLVCGFALKRGDSKLHGYLLFSCVSNLIYNTAYVLQLTAKDEQMYVTALKLGYLGRIWIGYALIIFTAQLCEVYLPKVIKVGAAILHIIIYFTILNLEKNDLYYNYMEFTMDGDFPKLLHSGGPLYYLQTVLNLIYVVAGIFIIVRAFVREKNSLVKKRYLMMVIAIFFVGSTYVIYFFKLVPLARKFDVMIIGYAICTVFMLIGIIKYGMLDATSAAKDYVVEELSEAIIVTDLSENITYYNNQAKELFPDLVVGEKAKKGYESLVEIFDSMTAIGQPVRMNGRIYTPKANPLVEGENEVGKLYSFTDDTEHYKYTDELKTQKQKADDANMAKSQFLANMSHEIRTPINAVLGFNEMIIGEVSGAEKGLKPEDAALKESFGNISKYAGNIQNAGGNLLSIINDILDFSKIEAGKLELLPADYKVVTLLNGVSNMIYFKAKDKGLKFDVEVDKDLPSELYGDVSRVRQIIINILSNAVKYTEKGSVKMSVRGEKEEAAGPDKRIRLVVEVRDTGIGIRKEDMERLFNKFQRLEMERNSTVEGTGLGLAISRQLLSLMNGDIEVDSKYGEGSIFTVSIPQRIISDKPIGEYTVNIENEASETVENKDIFTAPDASILIVDDTRMNITVAKGLLKKTKLQIDTATSGKEAIELCEKKQYDLILMDQRMPGMDGTQALNEIRAMEGGANIKTPVICMTADAIMGAKEKYIAEGFTDYISKPIDKHDLQVKISSYLPEDKVIAEG